VQCRLRRGVRLFWVNAQALSHVPYEVMCMAVCFKGAHVPKDCVLAEVCWYMASLLSTRHGEACMLERGIHVDHVTMHRWVIPYPQSRSSIPPQSTRERRCTCR
jgi:transposase-like protein